MGGGIKKFFSILGFFSLLLLVGGASYLFYGDNTTTDNRSRSLGLQKVDYNNTNKAEAATPIEDKVPPSVTVKNPINNSKVTKNTTVVLHAEAVDSSGVSKVDFFINGQLQCTDLTSIYTCDWKVPAKAAVAYTVMVKAYDAHGNSDTSEVKVTSK
jgi:hypothetical protein